MTDSQNSIERPKPTAEQKRAANVAYKQLLAKTIEIGEPIMQYLQKLVVVNRMSVLFTNILKIQ